MYYIDNVLVAVSVIDVLPKCVSSVYFFYKPKFSFLSLGKYSILRDIDFTKRINKVAPSLEWYYLGYYIHECPKMRYKGDYTGSELADPVYFNNSRLGNF